MYAQLIDNDDEGAVQKAEEDLMPFMESADATKFERDESDEFNRATRQPAMTFGIKTGGNGAR